MCNFYYGNQSKKLIKNKKALPLNGNKEISFDHIEVISRKNTKLIHFKNINKLPINLKKKVIEDLKVEDETQDSALGSIGLKPKIVH